MKKFGGEALAPESDPFYDAIPPGGEFVVLDRAAPPPEALHETPEETIARREANKRVFEQMWGETTETTE